MKLRVIHKGEHTYTFQTLDHGLSVWHTPAGAKIYVTACAAERGALEYRARIEQIRRDLIFNGKVVKEIP